MRRYRYYLPFVVFVVLFLVGLVFSPISQDSLATWSMILLAVAWLLDPVGVWYARRKGAGIQVEDTPLGTVFTFYNNPWAKGWTSLRVLVTTIFVFQVVGMGAATIFCGEVVHHLIWGK